MARSAFSMARKRQEMRCKNKAPRLLEALVAEIVSDRGRLLLGRQGVQRQIQARLIALRRVPVQRSLLDGLVDG